MPITIEGYQIVIDDLTVMIDAMQGDSLRLGLHRAALSMEASIKVAVVHLDVIETGFLLNSVMGFAPNDHGNPHDQASVEVGAEYAVYHEYGTRYMTARPFFTQGIESGADDAINAFGVGWLEVYRP